MTGLKAHEMVKRGMARTFQDFAPLEDRSIVRNVELSLAPDRLFTLSGVGGESRRLAEEICRHVGLEEVFDKTPSELLHADMLKLELAKAIANEPFAGLSSQEVAELSEILESLRQNGMTLIVVDHNMRSLLQLIDRVFVIQFGSKIADGSPEESTDNPKMQEAYVDGDEL